DILCDEHLDFMRLNSFEYIISNCLRERLTECAFITPGPEIELKRLALKAVLIRTVLNRHCTEIRLPSTRANCSEFCCVKFNNIHPRRLKPFLRQNLTGFLQPFRLGERSVMREFRLVRHVHSSLRRSDIPE